MLLNLPSSLKPETLYTLSSVGFSPVGVLGHMSKEVFVGKEERTIITLCFEKKCEETITCIL